MPVIGVGVDMVDIGRMDRAIESDRFCRRCFSAGEVAYAHSRGRPAVHLAARFAAKEALAKALGQGLARIGMAESEIVSGIRGPTFRLGPRAKALVADVGGARVDVSLSHESQMAIAVVVIST